MADDSHIRVMSQDERNDYDGVTIEMQTSEQADKQTSFFNKGIFVKRFKVFGKNMLENKQSWLMRFAILAVVIVVLSFVIFVALPIIITLAGVLAIIGLVMHFLFS